MRMCDLSKASVLISIGQIDNVFPLNGQKLSAQLMRADTNFLLDANEKRMHFHYSVASSC